MAAPKGNQFWKMGHPGKPKVFKTPAELWDAACEYFQWVEDNPLIEVKAFGTGLKMNVPHLRPFTTAGLCIFLNIDRQTFHNYGNDPNYKEYFDIYNRISQVIYNQKFEGAASGFLNPVIIARDLGLSEKIDQKTTSDINITPATDKQAELIEKLKNRPDAT